MTCKARSDGELDPLEALRREWADDPTLSPALREALTDPLSATSEARIVERLLADAARRNAQRAASVALLPARRSAAFCARKRALGASMAALCAAAALAALGMWPQPSRHAAEPAVNVSLQATREASRLIEQAQSCREHHDFACAEYDLQRAVALRERALGPAHTEVANALTELAEFYQSARLEQKAEPLLRRAFEIRPPAVF